MLFYKARICSHALLLCMQCALQQALLF